MKRTDRPVLLPPGATFAAPSGLRHEEQLFDRFCRQTDRARQAYVWVQSPCLVTTIGMTRLPGFEAAGACSARDGWPVYLRRSGGSTVFHGPDVLCVTGLYRHADMPPTLDAAYEIFTGELIAMLREFGVNAATGQAPDAPCDGRFNILVGSRKLAGTAMRRRTVAGRTYSLGHAAILVDRDYAQGLRAVEAFERALGLPAAYAPGACISLDELIPGEPGRAAIALTHALRSRQPARPAT